MDWPQAQEDDFRALRLAQHAEWIYGVQFKQEFICALYTLTNLSQDLFPLMWSYVEVPSPNMHSIWNVSELPPRLGACYCRDDKDQTSIIRVCGAHDIRPGQAFDFESTHTMEDAPTATFHIRTPDNVRWHVGLRTKVSSDSWQWIFLSHDGSIKTHQGVTYDDRNENGDRWKLWKRAVYDSSLSLLSSSSSASSSSSRSSTITIRCEGANIVTFVAGVLECYVLVDFDIRKSRPVFRYRSNSNERYAANDSRITFAPPPLPNHLALKFSLTMS